MSKRIGTRQAIKRVEDTEPEADKADSKIPKDMPHILCSKVSGV